MYPTHHAVVYIGHQNFVGSDFLLSYQSTHDVITQKFTEFRIADARQLIEWAYATPPTHTRQVFVVIAESIALEAQHALLKLLEEPPAISSFVFVLPHDILIPTLRSRCLIHTATTAIEPEMLTEFADFTKQSISNRLATIATLADKKDAAAYHDLKRGLLHYMEQVDNRMSKQKREHLHWLLLQMALRGASQKMLWEEVAFTLAVE